MEEVGPERTRHIRLLAWVLWSLSILALLISLLMGHQEALAIHPLVVLALPMKCVFEGIWAPGPSSLRRMGPVPEAWGSLGLAVLLAVAALWAVLK